MNTGWKTILPWYVLGSFDPRSISGLAMWLDAADTSTVTLDGSSNVSTWADKSGNGRDATQATTTRRPSYAATVNGRPVITFDGVDDQLRSSYVNTGTEMSVFMTFAKDAAGGTSNTFSRIFAMFDTVDTADWNTLTGISYHWDRAGNVVRVMRNSLAIAPVTAPSYGTFTTCGFRRNGTAITNWLAASTNTGTTASNTFSSTHVAVGGNNADGYMNGRIGEVIVYGRAVTDTEADTLIAYLKTKWGTA